MNATKQNALFRSTDEEMEIAKATDLPDLLEHLGYHVKKVGQLYTTREMDSLRIKNRRTWQRYSSQQAGDAITFLQDTYLRDNPNLRHVVLCLDADEPGQEAVKRLTAEYEGQGLKVSARVPPKGEDWNEFLLQRGPPREQERC